MRCKIKFIFKESIRLPANNQTNYDDQFYSGEGIRQKYDSLNKEYAKLQTFKCEKNLFKRHNALTKFSSGSIYNLQRFQPYDSNFESMFSKNNNKNKIFNPNSKLKLNGTEHQDSRMNSNQIKKELKLPPLFVANNS